MIDREKHLEDTKKVVEKINSILENKSSIRFRIVKSFTLPIAEAYLYMNDYYFNVEKCNLELTESTIKLVEKECNDFGYGTMWNNNKVIFWLNEYKK